MTERTSSTILTVFLLASFSAAASADVPFRHVIVDSNGPKDPWAKIIGDIDGDGKQGNDPGIGALAENEEGLLAELR